MATRKKYDNPQELRRYRKKLVIDAIRHDTKPERVPIMSHAWTWKIMDAGYGLREGLYDYDKLYDAVCQHHEKYEMDFYIDMGARNPLQVTDCFGGSLYVINDELDHLNIADYALMDEDDYDTFLQDGYIKYLFERGVPARYGVTDHDQMLAAYGKAAGEYMRLMEFNRRIANTYVNDFGVPNFCAGKPTNPLDTMIHTLRGIQGLSLDMRRNKKKLQAAIEILDEYWSVGFNKTIETYDPDDDKVIMAFRMTTLSHSVMNPRQFGEFSWPFIKRYCDTVAEHGWFAWLFTEGSIRHLVDYFQDIPEGHIGLLLEQDDPAEMQKLLPNVTIAGGFPVTLLQTGTQAQCVDKTKEMLDSLAGGGNYIFTTDKMMSFPEDGKGENLKAVVDYVKEYGKY